MLDEKQMELFGEVETKAKFDRYSEMKLVMGEEWEIERNVEQDDDTRDSI